MNKRKLSLKPEQWPAVDRRARKAAYSRGDDDLFDEVGLAAHWRPATQKKGDKAYGLFAHCLQRHDRLGEVASPTERFTRDNIKLFVRDVRSRGVASETLAGYVRDLREMARVMGGGHCPVDLVRASLTLEARAEPSRDQRDQLIAPSQLFYAGLGRMKKLWEAAAIDVRAGAKFGDGLMMSSEAAKALRLRNLAGMLVEHNIERNQLDEYEVKFKASETKTKRSIRAPLPSMLTKYFDYWFKIVRPNMLQGRSSAAMWITTKNTDMALMTVYGRFCKATLEETGHRINPHLTRKMIVTGIAIGAPELIDLAPAAIDHTTPRHTRDAYDLADDLAASRVVIGLVGRRRKAALKRSR